MYACVYHAIGGGRLLKEDVSGGMWNTIFLEEGAKSFGHLIESWNGSGMIACQV